jgi:catechol 2,3-dioxygenase-like lactoylglutathione lyase family enzyme
MVLQVSAIMLGVEDVERAKRFYVEGLGCEFDQQFPVSFGAASGQDPPCWRSTNGE